MKPELSVVIPTLGRPEVLDNCLSALARQTYKSFEVVVVSGDREGLHSLGASYPQLTLRIVAQDAPGLVAARNRGLQEARADRVSFIDDDCVPSPEWAGQLVRTFSQDASIGGVSGPTQIPEDSRQKRDILAFHQRLTQPGVWRLLGGIYSSVVLENQPRAVGRIFKSGAFSLGANYADALNLPEETQVDYLEACNMSFRRDALLAAGGFASCYGGIGDWSEPDAAFRIRAQGLKLIFNPRAVVIHKISQAGVFRQRGNDSRQRMINFITFYRRWIKWDRIEKCWRFAVNLVFLNLYWCYKFIQTGKPGWLGGIVGTCIGLGRRLEDGVTKLPSYHVTKSPSVAGK